MPSTIVWGAVLAFAVWAILRLSKTGSREPGLPPGPPTTPILGNMLIFPRSHVHLKFTEWARQYGELYSLKIGGATLVVISSAKMIREVLDKRSSTTSDRPNYHVATRVNSNLDMPWTKYGPVWRNLRRAAHDILMRSTCDRHIPIQRAEAIKLAVDLLDRPEGFFTHIVRYSSSVILSVCFGVHCPTFENTFIEEFYNNQRHWDNLLKPGNSPPVDVFPILKYVPKRWASWKEKCDLVGRAQRKLWQGLMKECTDRMEAGKRNDSFMEYIVDRKDKYNLNDEEVGWLGFALVEAGADTTSVYFQFFILMMTAFPEIRKKAQQEIDDVVGPNRLPMLEDFENLPYVNAVVNEVIRFRPITPTAVPHATTTDEQVGQYVIPKGATLFMNVWGVCHDPEFFEDPEVFNPDRFLKTPFGTKPGVDDTAFRNDFVFGAGRRICPGMHLANNSIALVVTTLLWAFDFNLAKDPVTGNPIPVDPNRISEGIILTPEPYKTDIQPRSQARADFIRKEFAAARPTFEQFERSSL